MQSANFYRPSSFDRALVGSPARQCYRSGGIWFVGFGGSKPANLAKVQTSSTMKNALKQNGQEGVIKIVSTAAPTGVPTTLAIPNQTLSLTETDAENLNAPLPLHNPASQPSPDPEEILFRALIHGGLPQKTASPALQQRIRSLVLKNLQGH